MSSERGSSDPAKRADWPDLEADLRTLSASALRLKYKGEASSHANMKVRCKEGFELDPAWNEFSDFLRDMGPRPHPSYSIDRIDPLIRKYGPDLCRWASKKEQTENRSSTIWIEFEGRDETLADLARRFDVPYTTLHAAYSRGETPTQIAARLKGTSSEYCPDHILGDALAVRDWRASFKAWKEKLPREHRWMAEPEVFDLITCSRQLQSGAKWLERRGFFELAGEEHEEAEALLGTPQGLAWQHGHVRIRKALKALVGRAPKVAVRVAKSGQTYDHFVRFADWMEKPS